METTPSDDSDDIRSKTEPSLQGSSSGKPPANPPPQNEKSKFIFERRFGVNELLTFLAVVAAGMGLIYQRSALVTAKEDLNSKIQTNAELTERLKETAAQLEETQKRVVQVQRDFINYSLNVADIAFGLRKFDAMFDQEMHYAAALSIEALIRLDEAPADQRSRIAENIVGVIDMNRVLALKKYQHTVEADKQLAAMRELTASVEGKVLSLEELVEYGGRLKLIVAPKLLDSAKSFTTEIKEPFSTRTKYMSRVEEFMQDRAAAYVAAKTNANHKSVNSADFPSPFQDPAKEAKKP